MRANWVGRVLALGLVFALPGNAHRAAAHDYDQRHLSVAIAVPRNSELARGLRQVDEGLLDATQGRWRLKIYPSGVSGDEKDVVRKMRVGACMDAAVLTSTGLSAIVKELAVLAAPGVIESYEHAERVRAAFASEWSQKFAAEGFSVLGWSEVGMLRYFSKAPLHSLADLKQQRSWIWPDSSTMRAMWRAIGAGGVPLTLLEVHGALQNGTINAAMSTSVGAVAMQWSSMFTHVTQRTQGPLLSAFVLAKSSCGSLPDDVRESLKAQVALRFTRGNLDVRADDARAYKGLLKSGYVSVPFSAEGEAHYQAVAKQARESLTGSMYTRELLEKVMSMAP